MSVTATATEVQRSHVLHLTTRPLIARVDALTRRMLDSELFSDRREFIAKWKQRFLELADSDKESASLALCYLLVEVINPAMESSQEADLFCDFEDRVKQLLSQFTPSVEVLLTEYRQGVFEREQLQEKIKAIEEWFFCQVELLYAERNVVGEKLAELFAELKGRLLEITSKQATVATSIRQQIDRLAERIRKVAGELSEKMESIRVVKERESFLAASLQKSASDCEGLLELLRKR